MASILKNQILKHLSKFTKNLSPDKLQLSAFKGSFEVRNIELNEDIIMELLELPVWIKLTKADCNFASIKIQWMKLKTVPISITLDEVVIHGEICEDFRQEVHTGIAQKLAQESTSSYGFTQKIIDGITLMINSVNVQFKSNIFNASIELTRISVESRNCLFKKVDDLSKTRIRDPSTGQVLLFKHIEWQTFRFVANSNGQAPLRLIASQASCRLTLKKRLSDCAILGARIMIIFEDLLWVLTDSQLLSALRFVDYLGGLINKAPRTKNFQNESSKNGIQEQAKAKMMNSMSPKKVINSTPSALTALFNQYDFLETSHHLIVKRIEVHLMDDCVPQSVKSGCSELDDGGALQITFLQIMVDIYPYQQINGSRKHWFRYSEPSTNRQSFINHKLRAFFAKQQSNDIPNMQSQLMSGVVVVRLRDYSIGMVSTNKCRNKDRDETADTSKLIHFDKSKIIPSDMSPIYIEINSYFYIDGEIGFPTPEPTMFASIAPIRINFDPLTLLWINAFFSNLRFALIKLQEAFPQSDSDNSSPMNLRVEIMSPTIVVSFQGENFEEYSALEINVSRILIYNSDAALPPDYFKNLEGILKYFASNMGFYFEKTDFPWLGCDMKSISNEFVHQISRWFASKGDKTLNQHFEINFLVVSLEPIWIEFKSNTRNCYEPFVEPVNATLWMREGLPGEESGIDMNIIVKINSPVKVQLSHGQLMFLLRLLEKIGEFTAMLDFDQLRIQSSHMKGNFEINNKESQHNDQEFIKNIFKTTALVTTIPEVNVFLKISEQEVEVGDAISNQSDSIIENRENGSTNGILSIHDISPIESSLDSNFLNKPSPHSLDGVIIKQNSQDMTIRSPSPIFGGDPLLNIPIENLKPSESQQSIGSMSVLTPETPSVPKSPLHTSSSTSRLNAYSTNNSFDTNSFKFHYSNQLADNDDTLSTISDYSDNDQSLYALIDQGNNNYDDIFIDGDAEVAEELSENFGKEEGDAKSLLQQSIAALSISTVKPKRTFYDVLQIKLRDLNIIHQSPRGFLSQIFVETKKLDLQEHFRLDKEELARLFRDCHERVVFDNDSISDVNEDFHLRVRIDSFTKGRLKQEMISVFIEYLAESLHKETIDSVVKFFEDKFAENVAPTAILLKNVSFKIIDNAVKIPPAEFNIPKLHLSRDNTNRWIIDLNDVSDSLLSSCLLEKHLNLLQRNELGNIEHFIRERDRFLIVNRTQSDKENVKKKHNSECDKNESVLEQVLNQKDLLIQEIELLRKENEQLKAMLKLTH